MTLDQRDLRADDRRSRPRADETIEAIRREAPAVTITIETPRDRRRHIVLTEDLVARLRRVVKGQDAALERIATTVATQLAKTNPSRPGTVLLLGATGTGKTTAIEALPTALDALGHRGTHVHRVDCGELASSHQIARLLGAPPGYVGHDEETPFGAALGSPGCILLLDEVDRAHPSIIETALVGLLDRGRLSSPTGDEIDGAHAVIAMTTNLGADDLDEHLRGADLTDRWVVARRCRELLLEHGFSEPLLARIGAFAVFEPLGERTRRLAAGRAILALAQEYGFAHASVEPVLKDTLIDIAEHGLGARALDHAARELLGEAFAHALAEGLRGQVRVTAGPPPAVISRA